MTKSTIDIEYSKSRKRSTKGACLCVAFGCFKKWHSSSGVRRGGHGTFLKYRRYRYLEIKSTAGSTAVLLSVLFKKSFGRISTALCFVDF